jgi:plasmid stabilization system protein ParE
MKLRVTETAFAELNDIALYIAQDSPGAAVAVVRRIEQVFDRIRDFPSSHMP